MSGSGFPSLKDFVDAMGVAWPIAFAAGLASGGIVAANYCGLPYAVDLNQTVLLTLAGIAVFSTSICLTHMIVSILKVPLALLRWWRTKHYRKWQVKRLHELPPSEAYVMRFLLAENTQAFYAPFGHARLVNLLTKELVIRLDGQHSILEWPHIIPDHIWDEMARHPGIFNLSSSGERSSPFARYF